MSDSNSQISAEQFRQVLIGLRVRNGLSQSSLASRLEKPQSFVSKYETGERRLDVLEFIAICHALAISPAEVIQQLVDGE